MIFSAAASLASRDVVFQQRVAAGDDHAFQPADDAVGRAAPCWRGRVLDEHRFVLADFVEDAQPIGGERAAGFDEVDDRVGHAERDHHFDRAGELDDVRLRLCAWRGSVR